MKCQKLLNLILLFVFVCISTSYPSTKKYWEEVDKAIQNGLPKTAITSLEKILKVTQKEKKYDEWLRALTQKIAFEASIQGNRPEEKVKRLKKEFATADFSTRQLLKAILAQWYWHYYSRNKYRFMKRTQTAQLSGEDFTTWDLKKIFNEIDSLYQDILKEKELLTNIPVEKFLGFLEPGTSPLEFRPTLYDFIAQEALSFYTRAEHAAARPEDAFEIDANSKAFGPVTEFLIYKPMTEDTLSAKFKAIRIYQSLMEFHKENKNTEALLDLDLQRLKYIKNYAIGEEKNKIYILRLEEIIKQYKNLSLSSLGAYYLAKACAEEGDLAKAYEVAKIGNRNFPDSPGGRFCEAYMIQLTLKSLRLVCENYIPPGSSKAKITYKNFTKLYFKVFPDEWDAFMEKNTYPNYTTNDEITELLEREPCKEWEIDLPATRDLKEKSIEIDIPELESGYYRIFASWMQDFKKSTMVQHTWFWVCPFTLVTRPGLNISDGLVLDAITGEPIHGVLVSKIVRNDNRYIYSDTTYTNSNGMFEYKPKSQKTRDRFLYIRNEDDELLYPGCINYYSYRSAQSKNETFFFTDRSIYRPGQTIYFKGICVHIDKEKNNYEVLKNRKVVVLFSDANGKEITKNTYITNEFGSFSGQVTAPMDRLTGRMSISVKQPRGSASFRVEEYKRPKFTVEIQTPKEAFRVNQEVEISGRATAYTGAPVNNASVRYRVQRSVRYPYWWGWYYSRPSKNVQLITHGQTKTDAKGKFSICFFAKPDLNISPDDDPRFTYEVNADVISPDGETRSDKAFVVLGYSALAVKLTTKDQPQNNKQFSIQIATQTLDGNNIPADAVLQIYRLNEPQNPIPKKLWGEEYKHHDNQNNEGQFLSDWKTWPKSSMVYETDVSTSKDNPKSVIVKLPTGLYQLECSSKDKFGNQVKAFLPLMVLPNWNEKVFSIRLPSIAKTNNNVIEVGKNLEVLWGTGYETGRCFVEIEHGQRIIKRYWTNKNQTQHTFSFPVTEKHRGGFVVHLTQISENRAYTNVFNIQVPWDNKELTISMESFRDKLTPGKKETITLKIKGKKQTPTAELVATMYDFSLDQFYPHSWKCFRFSKRYFSRSHRTFINRAQRFQGWHGGWNEKSKYPRSATYIHFPHSVAKDYLFYRFPVFGAGKVTHSKHKVSDRTKGTFSGRVIDARNGEPLPYANIIIEGTSIGSVTDMNGDFFIINVPVGTYSVTVKMMGYEPTTITNVKSVKGHTATINFELTGSVVMMPEVTVYARKPIVEHDVSRTNALLTGASMVRADGPAGGFKAEYGEQEAIDMKDVVIRRHLDETAFFYPHLQTKRNGTVEIEFNSPEALTKWKFLCFAHGKRCESGNITKYTVTQKELMVQPNPPRFLREGDTLYFTSKVINMSKKIQEGRVQLDFKDLITDKLVNDVLKLSNHVQTFKIEGNGSKTFLWKISIPKGMNPLSYTVMAKSEKHSDGEAGAIPVLSSRIFLTESFPFHIGGPQTRKFNFNRLKEIDKTETLEPFRFTVQMSSNPGWYAIQALPYLTETHHECSERIFNRYYANILGQLIVNSNPRIKEVFDQWRGSDALKSNLEKNQDLKSVLLAETPWVVQAQNETQSKRNVGMLFEENNLKNNLNSALTKLKNIQLPNGSWPWFPGGLPSPYFTLYIMTGFGRLRHLDIQTDISLAAHSIDYLDSLINETYNRISDKSRNHLTHRIAFYLYGRSFFLKEKPIASANEKAVSYFLQQAEQNWLRLNSRLSQGYLALALNRFGKTETAKKIMASIKERSVSSEEMGMYWRETERSWWWYRAPIETQALMIEAFLEVINDTTSAEECKVWLLKQKQTQNWKTSKATADAVYALILRGMGFLSSTKLVKVKLGETEVTPEKVEAGTGYYEKIYLKKEIQPQFSNIYVTKEDEGIAWGGVYFQYFEEMSAVTSHTTNLQLDKKLFINKETKRGNVIVPVTGTLSVGDLITIRIVLRVDRDMEYVHLKDLRGSGFEPVDVLSRYRYQDGLRYYQSTKDVATHFFIDYLPKGTYVFEYNLRVQHKGQYQSGIAEIQCMYAPEFNSHSQSQWLNVQ